MQNSIGCCFIKSLTCNVCFPPPPHNCYALAIVIEEMSAWHQITPCIKGCMFWGQHNASCSPAILCMSLVRNHRNNLVSVHQSSPLVQSSDCKQPMSYASNSFCIMLRDPAWVFCLDVGCKINHLLLLREVYKCPDRSR